MYFIKITSNSTPKNSLQKYLSDQLGKLECLTIENPDELKQHLERLVLRANITYKRCTPLKAYLHKSYSIKSNYSAGVDGLVQLTLYHQRGVFSSLEQQRRTSNERQEGEQATLFTLQPTAS